MTVASAASHKAWGMNDQEHPSGLGIVLPKRSYVFPWSQFLYAEGDSEEVRLVFSTHDVIVKGSRLDLLFPDLSAQRVSVLREFVRAERFAAGDMPTITSISVRKVG